MNICYSDTYVFAGNDGLNAPFQWDGGKLMKSFKTWLHTTQKHLVFVYCSNDPWTGGAIEDINDNTNIMKLVVPGGRHSDHFLTEFDKASSATLQGMISAYIKH